MKTRRSMRSHKLVFGMMIVFALFAGACRTTERPDLRGNRLSFEGRDIDSRAEHKDAVNALIENLSVLPGLEQITAVFIESEALIGIQGAADPEYLRVRSLRKEVAMRSVEMSDYVVQAYVTDDPVLFRRIQSLRERLDRGEDAQQLRDDVAAIQATLRQVGTSSDPEDGSNAGKTESEPPLAGEPAGPKDKIQSGQPPWPR